MNYLLKAIKIIAVVNIFWFQACNNVEVKAPKPNVVLFLIDDYGYADISFEGNTQIQTPAIDKIAKEGVQFTNFYQSASACAPTRASLLTGKYHLRTGVWGVHWGRDYISTNEITFANLAKNAGYVTGAFGKWHSGKSSGYHSWERGFDVGLESNLYKYFNTNVLVNNKLVNIEGPVTDAVTDNAIKFIEQNRDTSFLCYIPYQSVHEPFNCPDSVFQKYKAQGYSNHVARLYGMIEVMDNNINRVLTKISDLGLDENTLIMFMVDDGCSPGFDLTYSTRRMNEEEKAERRKGWAKELRGTKANIYEGGVKSPCYMRWKGKLNAGTQIHTLSGVIDVLPTLAEICGFEMPKMQEAIDGVSLAPAMFGDTNLYSDRFYFDNTNLYRIPVDQLNMDAPEIREMSVRHKNFKLVRLNYKIYGDDTVRYNLYDLATDEKEEHNVAANYPEITTVMKDTLNAWFKYVASSKNAFKPCTYNLGNWNEPSVWINLDGNSAKTGSLKRDNGSGFTYENWTAVGNSLSYNLNVAEEGDYAVEIFIDADEKDFGSVFEVYTEYASSELEVNHAKSIKSGVLHLPKGKQSLTIKLKTLGKSGKALTKMKNLLVHYLPKTSDNVVQNPEIKAINTKSKERIIVRSSNAPFSFATNGGIHGKTINAKVGEEIELNFSSKNTNQIEKMELYLNFDKIDEIKGYEPNYKLKLSEIGLHTLNVEYTSKGCFKCVNQLNVDVN